MKYVPHSIIPDSEFGPQHVYRFPNGFGASVITNSHGRQEVAILLIAPASSEVPGYEFWPEFAYGNSIEPTAIILVSGYDTPDTEELLDRIAGLDRDQETPRLMLSFPGDGEEQDPGENPGESV